MQPPEKLDEEKKRLLQEVEVLLSMVPVPVVVTDASGNILHANAVAESVWKRSQITLTNKHIRDVVEGEEIEALIEQGKPAQKISVRIKDAANFLHMYECRIRPLFVYRKVGGAVLQFTSAQHAEHKERIRKHTVRYTFSDIRGNSDIIASLKSQSAHIAPTDSTILIRGESGTGKEVFAQAIHATSTRKDGPFVALNCAAIPESLLESELFGYEEGSFTGAKKGGKEGRFEMARGGTLFLDEIGDMPLFLQAKLLRVLQERRIERIGGTDTIPIDVRVIAATHKNLEAMIADGRFREDLYFRLNVIPLYVPPLRNRKEDLYDLIHYFMKKCSTRLGKEQKRLSSQALKRLYDYHWPGNIRELENVVEYIMNLEIGELITVTSLPSSLRKIDEEAMPELTKKPPTETAHDKPYEISTINEKETELILQALQRFEKSTEGKKKAAASLGISLSTLYRRLQKLRYEKKFSK
ncbi:Fis family transcriptional regulator [Aneurinibacillus migulanus]|uniref:sigma-54 interaction domain-containing protein n=1 Tax=Aneurinibacillus migulanus TaxID=47500 RepID=UPI0005BE8EA0|nr:sigma 54-interacting transcriptional regulator [Aneurinibacillus migulanus]KIV53850.1 Fis family transcriptional regulator [Aneurinibacillus migulanus]KPD08199.1 Fis family transcriptional regulator [Aneurinibacillus migulanus]MCP1357091.1 sigma 54-interacting transcriptional regulator [Aneurinibacillus migulanus]CEH30508.1 Sigma-54 interaction domain protein [Aneurinibacillus migulanus]